jgi:hypothetical protein
MSITEIENKILEYLNRVDKYRHYGSKDIKAFSRSKGLKDRGAEGEVFTYIPTIKFWCILA